MWRFVPTCSWGPAVLLGKGRLWSVQCSAARVSQERGAGGKQGPPAPGVPAPIDQTPCRRVSSSFWVFKGNWKLDFMFTFQIKGERRMCQGKQTKRAHTLAVASVATSRQTCVLDKSELVKHPHAYARAGLHRTTQCSRDFRVGRRVANVLPSHHIFIIKHVHSYCLLSLEKVHYTSKK